MSKIFKISTLSQERIHEICSNGNGSYTYDFTSVTAERLERASKGYTREALEALAGRYVIFESYYDGGRTRATPIPEQFKASERACIMIDGASFSALALDNFRAVVDNGLFRSAGICLKCGKVLLSIDARHVCGERACIACGQVIPRGVDGDLCDECARKRVERVYSYHGRPHRSNPLFEKPDKREAIFHGGIEDEIEGSDAFYAQNERARDLSRIMNDDIRRPFIEFETDGSINNGIECITAPVTYDGMKKRLNAWRAFYDYVKTEGGKFARKNGLHVHIDRRFFGDEHRTAQVYIELLVYKYFDFFATISHRESDCFYYATKKDGVRDVITSALNLEEQSHSNAVNGGGCNTIELRIFGGHIDSAEKLLAVFDITQAIARWAKGASITEAQRCTPSSIVKYLKDVANVKAFVEDLPARRYRTGAGDICLNDFIKTLNKKLQGGNN